MKIRTVSWEIILAGLFFTGIAIYVSTSRHSADAKPGGPGSSISGSGSVDSVIVDPGHKGFVIINRDSASRMVVINPFGLNRAGWDSLRGKIFDIRKQARFRAKKEISRVQWDSLNRVLRIRQGALPHAGMMWKKKYEFAFKDSLNNLFSFIPPPPPPSAVGLSAITKNSPSVWTGAPATVPASETLMKSRTFSAADIKRVSLETSVGKIRVTGSRGDKIHVMITGRKGSLKRDFDNHHSVSMETRDGELYVSVTGRNWGWTFLNWLFHKNNEGNIIVEMPEGVPLHVESKGGSIDCRSLHGGVEAGTLGGNISLRGVSGSVQARTVAGNVVADAFAGDENPGSSVRSIQAGNVQGDVRIRTTAGNISLKNISSGSIDAETTGGNIDVQIPFVSHDITLKATAGNINLSIPRQTRALLDLKGTKVAIPSGWSVSGNLSESHVDGSLNGGSYPRITAHTDAGTVALAAITN